MLNISETENKCLNNIKTFNRVEQKQLIITHFKCEKLRET